MSKPYMPHIQYTDSADEIRAVGSARQLALLRPGALYGSNKKMTVTSYKISHEIKQVEQETA